MRHFSRHGNLAIRTSSKRGPKPGFDQALLDGFSCECIETLVCGDRNLNRVSSALRPALCNDGAAALLLASEAGVKAHGLNPMARILAMQAAGVAPRVMGIGPVPATRKVLAKTGLTIDDMDVIELNEAFASQGLATLRELGIADDDPRVNPQGGAIALGHPLGMSGARLVSTAAHQLRRSGGRRALCTMCIGVGQGIALIIERV